MDKRPSTEPSTGAPNKIPRQDDGNSPSTSQDDAWNRLSTSATGLIALMCYLCNVTFSAVNNLNRHIATIHGNQSFICSVCGKTFNQKTNLTRHEKTHVLKKKSIPECLECNKTFTRPSGLAQHLLTHKLQTCEECGKDFQTKAALTQHRKTHTNVPLARAGDPKPSTDPRDPASATCPPKGCKTALKGSFARHRTEGTETDVDLPAFLWSLNHADLIRDAVRSKKGIKFFVSANVQMIRPKGWIQRGAPRSYPYFTSHCQRVLEVSNVN